MNTFGDKSKGKPFFSRWRVQIALWLSLFVVSFNIYVMTVVIVPVTRDLGANIASVQNALVLVSLVMASFVATSENLGDVYGHKRLFLFGLVVFAIGLTVTALSHNVLTLLLGYGIITGVGATPMVTLPWTLMNESYQGRKREFALLALSLALVSGSLAGPFLGGYLTTASDWRWAFAPQLLVVIFIWFLARPVQEIIKTQNKTLDLGGGLLSFLGLALILLGLNLTNEYGWWTAKKFVQIGDLIIPPPPLSIAPVLMTFGLIIIVVFAFYWRRRERVRGKDQVWRFSLFKRRRFSVGLTTSALYAIGTAGLTYTLYLFLQTALDLTPFDTALAVSPYYIAMLLVMVATFRLDRWLERKYIVQVGLVTFFLGLVSLIRSLEQLVGISPMIPGLVVMGTGAGLVIGQMAEYTLSATNFEERGQANGIYNTLQDLGYSFGICIFGSSLIYQTSAELVERVLQALNVSLGDAEREELVTDLEHSLQILSKEEQVETFSTLPMDVQQAIDGVARSAEFSAMESTLWGVAIVFVLSLLVSVFLPKTRAAEGSL